MSEETKIPQLQLRYEQTTALYASQFVISTNGEEVIINFSSGGLPDKDDAAYLPVHTRIALTATVAKNLANLLNQALSESNKITVSNSLNKVIH